MKRTYPYNPDYYVNPGETLREVIEYCKIDIFSKTGLTKEVIDGLLDGSEPLTPEISIVLEKATGISAKLWESMERMYRLGKMANEKLTPNR